jgi:hypothetical protein
MPNIISKKTFKVKPAGFQVATEKSFSFHGSVSQATIQEINRILSAAITYTNGANKPLFKMDASGHYFASMNHNCQKHHEEDIIVAILDVMEAFGWTFRFQYDSESSSVKLNGSSETSRELFIFNKAA